MLIEGRQTHLFLNIYQSSKTYNTKQNIKMYNYEEKEGKGNTWQRWCLCTAVGCAEEEYPPGEGT